MNNKAIRIRFVGVCWLLARIFFLLTTLSAVVGKESHRGVKSPEIRRTSICCHDNERGGASLCQYTTYRTPGLLGYFTMNVEADLHTNMST
jgi:hypothetical protein